MRDPVLLAAFEGWNDAGDAASGALAYLSRTWDARRFATLDGEELFDFTSVRPEVHRDDSGKREISWPKIEVSAAAPPGSGRDVVLLSGPEPQMRWKTFGSSVVDVARQAGVQMVVTLGALLADVPHTRPVRVTGTAPGHELRSRLGLSTSRYEGPTGILGVLQDAFEQEGIPSASLWASVPHYVSQSPSPKATLALVERTTVLLGTRVEAVDLQLATAAYDRQIDELVAADEEATAYVARLEASGDELEEEPEMPSDGSGLAAEVERFLRDQHRD